MKKKLILGFASIATILVMLPMFAAFEAHVINVTAQIENALLVHPEGLEYGTVFPQEHLLTSFFISFSNSFSATDQRRVGTVEYRIKQKPKPLPAFEVSAGGVDIARAWCHDNYPATPYSATDPLWTTYLGNCYPSLCPYLSKTPDGLPSSGQNANNDVGLPPFHNPWTQFALGKLVKFNANGTTIDNDPSDTWTIDLAVPCFAGQCAQDWPSFVQSLNPNAGDAEQYKLPQDFEHEVFGCDLWVEVTDIY